MRTFVIFVDRREHQKARPLRAPTHPGPRAPTARPIPAWAIGPGYQHPNPRSPVGAHHPASTKGQTFSHRSTRAPERQRRAPYQPGPTAQVTDAPIPEAL